MGKVKVVTDSHSSISKEAADKLGVVVIPMPFEIDGEEYLEGVSLTRQDFYDRMRSGSNVCTSQPAPTAVTDVWKELLKTYDEIVYIPISSGLSGSCSTATAMASDDRYDGRVFVVDNGRVATPMYRSVLDAVELVNEGKSGSEVKAILEEYRAQMNIYVAVDTLENLKKGGRVSAMTAAVGSVLNIKPVLQFDVGTLDVVKKCRGMKAARKAMIELLRQDFETKFREAYESGEIYLLAAGSADKETTEDWLKEIAEAFPGMDILYEDLSLAVTCHIGVGGLGIGCSVRPKR